MLLSFLVLPNAFGPPTTVAAVVDFKNRGTVYQGEASKPGPQDHLKILDEEAGRGSRLDGYRVPVIKSTSNKNQSFPLLRLTISLHALSLPFLT